MGQLSAIQLLIDNKLVGYEIAKNETNDINQEFEILDAEERHAWDRFNSVEHKPKPDELVSIENEIANLEAFRHGLELKITQYELLHEGYCGTCYQKITQDYLAQEVLRLKNEEINTNKCLKELNEREDVLLGKYIVDVENVKIAAKFEYEQSIHGIKSAREKIKERLNHVQQLEREISGCRNQVSQITFLISAQQALVTQAKQNVDYLNQRMAEYEKSQLEMQCEITNNNNLKHEQIHYQWVERNLKKVKLGEYELMIDRLNILLAEELMNLWGSSLTARFVTAKEKVKGGLKAELDLLVQAPNVLDVPIEMHSGGEQKILIVAIFKAMRRLIKERGQGVNISAIDELDKDLDDVKVDKLVESFESIAQDSSTCIIISHNSRLLNTMQFDHIWTVTKKNGFSTLNTKEIS